MANDMMFEGKERRLAGIEKCLAEYGMASLEEAREVCLSKGIDVEKEVKSVQQKSKAYSPSPLKTRFGHIPSALPLPLRAAAPKRQTPLPKSALVCRRSAFPVR